MATLKDTLYKLTVDFDDLTSAGQAQMALDLISELLDAQGIIAAVTLDVEEVEYEVCDEDFF